MIIRAVCIPCIFQVRSKEILSSNIDEREKKEALRGLLKLMYELSRTNASTTFIASEAFRYVKRVTKDPDPYREYKRLANEVARRLVPKVRKMLEGLEGYGYFRRLVTIAVNANSIDPGVPSFKFGFEMLGDLLLNEEFSIDHRERIYGFLKGCKRVIYLLDNAGEAVFDVFLVKFLACEMDLDVTVVTKTFPYQNDVTVEEALELGFKDYARVLGTGNDYSGLLPGTYAKEVRDAINEADVIVAKGMAHYETFLYAPVSKPVIHLFKAKCAPVASTLKVSPGSNIALLKN